MSDQNPNFEYRQVIESFPEEPDKPTKTEIARHALLFLATFASVALSSAALFVGRDIGMETSGGFWMMVLRDGSLFAVLLLGFLGIHEFGHYFAAVYHRVKVSLPYFIPLPLISPIGTIGAVIRIREPIHEMKKMYDIGIAGPVAGFVVSLGILLYGFFTLPGPEYLQQFTGHDELNTYVAQYGTFPDSPPDSPYEETGGQLLFFGNTILYAFIASFFENVPPLWEMYHYPFLLAGWLGLFFTALNMMPVGQLDGGHILYGLLGYKNHQRFARVFFTMIVGLAGIGMIPIIHSVMGTNEGHYGLVSWSAWALISYFIFRKAFYGHPVWTVACWASALLLTFVLMYFIIDTATSSGYGIWFFWTLFILFFVKIEHPPVTFETELSPGRRLLGWVSLAIFILCISPAPIYLVN